MPDDAPHPEVTLPMGPAHALMIEHFTNMTAMQQRVCQSAVDEYRELQSEHSKLMVELARVTQKLMASSSAPVQQPVGSQRPRYVEDRRNQMTPLLYETADVVGFELENGLIYIDKMRKGRRGATVTPERWRGYANNNTVETLLVPYKALEKRARKR